MLIHLTDDVSEGRRGLHLHAQLDRLQKTVVHDYLRIVAAEGVAGLYDLLQGLLLLMGNLCVGYFLVFIDFVDDLLEDVAGLVRLDDVGQRHIGGNMNDIAFKGQIPACELPELILQPLDRLLRVVGLVVQSLIVDSDVAHDTLTQLEINVGSESGVIRLGLGSKRLLNLLGQTCDCSDYLIKHCK